MITIYGIKNCDTMKKAFKWLGDHNIGYNFHDYKKSGIDESIIKQAITDHGWERVINKRGTTWRQLEDIIKNNIDTKLALNIAIDNPSIIKRPLLLNGNKIIIGFDENTYTKALK